MVELYCGEWRNLAKRKKEHSPAKTISPSEYQVNDSPSRASHPNVKILLNTVAFFLLGNNFDILNSSYFVSVIMFTLLSFFEWASFVPSEKVRLSTIFIRMGCEKRTGGEMTEIT